MKLKKTKKEKPKTGFMALSLMMALVLLINVLTVALVDIGLFLLIQRSGRIDADDLNTAGGKLIFALTIIACVIVSAVITFFMSKILSRPFKKLLGILNSLASGNYETRVHFGKNMRRFLAVRELEDSFNTMAAELQNTEMLRSDFVNNFSHEFKTPIASILGFTRLLKYDSPASEQQAEYLGIIEDEALRLSSMATGILNLTKIENQQILTNVTEYNVSEQLRNCILLLQPGWEKKELELRPEFDEYTIEADKELLKQVWINILDNAIKFTPKHGDIFITAEENTENVTVHIGNTGSEIPPEAQQRIFGKFYQADESHSGQGNGIGLSVAKKIVQLHKGDISVASHDMQTVFSVTLPKRRTTA